MKRITIAALFALLAALAFGLPSYPPPTILTNLEEYFLANDPVLADGEFAYCTDTHTLKIGDGVTQWTVLVSAGEPLLTSVVGVPKSVLTYYNPELTYTSRSIGMSTALTSAIDFTDSSLYRVTDNTLSISFFVKASSTAGNQVVLCRGSFGGNVGYYLQLNDGYWDLLHGNTGVLRVKADNYLDRWVHIVLVKEPGVGWKMWKNTLECTYILRTAGNPTTCDNVFFFGAYDGTSNYYNGLVADIKIFNLALTQENIDDLYYGEENVEAANLKGWWRCNETTGTVVADSSTSAIDGTYYGDIADLYSTSSPYTKAVLTGIFYKYVECLGGRVMDPLSPFCGTEVPDYGLDNDIIWAWKVFP